MVVATLFLQGNYNADDEYLGTKQVVVTLFLQGNYNFVPAGATVARLWLPSFCSVTTTVVKAINLKEFFESKN